MKKYDLTTQSMVRIAMFTAVLSVLFVLQIPSMWLWGLWVSRCLPV